MSNKEHETAKRSGGTSTSLDNLRTHLLEDNLEPVKKVPWLKIALGQDVDLLERQHRRIYAEIFLQAILYPALEQNIVLDEENVADLLSEYRETISGPGQDFELSNVVGGLLNRLNCYSEDGIGEPVNEFSALEKDLALFMTLSELDIEKVTELVSLKLSRR